MATTQAKSILRPGDIIHILRQRWPIGAAIGIVLGLVVTMVQLNETPMYRSGAKLMVEIDPDKMVQVQDMTRSSQAGRIYDTIINAYLERLRSRSMATVVLEGMNERQIAALLEYYPDVPKYTNEAGDEFPQVNGMILGAVSTFWNPNVQTITITAEHPDPKIAQIIVQAYSDSLILMQSSRLEERTGQILTFLEEQSKELQNQLAQGEVELQEFRSEQNLSSVEGSIDLVTQSLSQLRSSLTAKKIDLIALENQITQIDAAEENIESLLEISFITNRDRVSSSLIALQEAETSRKVLAQTYGRRHPIMVENQAVIDTRTSTLERAIQEIIAEIRQDFEVTKTGYDSLLNELKETEAQALELDRMAIDYRVLERKLDVQKQMFDVVAQQFTNTDISSRFDMASIEILDAASLPGEPFSPDAQKAFMMGGFLFFACLIGIPIGLEMLDNRLKTFADIENFVGKPVYGDIKRFRDKSDKELSNAVLGNDEDLAESFRGIYSSLKLYTEIKPPYALIVTSSLPSEGKTFVACNVAAAFSKHQMRTILVDCDLRRPSVHRQFALKNDVGVIEWIESDAKLPTIDNLTSDPHLGIHVINDNLHVLCSGGSTKEPTEIIGHERFNRLISRLKEAYDAVIIDTPPAGLFPDASLAADFAGQTLFVAKHKQVSRQKVRFAVNRLERSNAPVAGVVLNHITGHSVATGYGYYGQNYSYAYGYERDQEKYKSYYEAKPEA